MTGPAADRLSLAEAEALAAAALRAAGTAEANAKSVARALVRAEADGQGGHGLSRIPSYAAQCRVGKVRGAAVPVLEEVLPAVFRVDAGLGFAYPALDLAIPALATRARAHGIALAAIRHSHHFGVAGHAAERLAEAGCIGLVYGNAPRAMAPAGASVALLGTNPVGFAAPMPGGPPLVIDFATSMVARGKILAAREAAKPIPEGWALDAAGRPTTDPVAALAGTVAPMGGAKGAALALMIEVMAAGLTGGRIGAEASSLLDAEGPPPDIGQVLIAIDAAAVSGGGFAERMAAIATAYAGAGARLPGTRRLQARERAAREGLGVDPVLLARIRELAG